MAMTTATSESAGALGCLGCCVRLWRRTWGLRHVPGDRCALAGSRTHRETSAESTETVLHVLQAGAYDALGVESSTVVFHFEADLIVLLAQRQGDARVRAAVLGRVLDRFQTRVVDRRLDF